MDLIQGVFNLAFPNLVSVGQPGVSGLALSESFNSLPGDGAASWSLSFFGQIGVTGPSGTCTSGLGVYTFTVGIGGASDAFATTDCQTFTNATGSTSTLSYDGSHLYTYTASDGTQVVYDALRGPGSTYAYSNNWISSVTYPSGEVVTVSYNPTQWCQPNGLGGCANVNITRAQSISSSLGYQIQLKYALDSAPGQDQLAQYFQMTSATAFSLATDYCAPTATSCTFSQAWPQVTFDNGLTPGTITDALGRATTLTYTANAQGISQLTGVKRPSGLTLTIHYDAPGRVTSVTNGTTGANYSYTTNNGANVITATDLAGRTRRVTSDPTTFLVSSDISDPGSGHLNRGVTYSYDTSERLTRVTLPSGAYTQIVYDDQGRVTSTTKSSADGSLTSTTSATYAALGSCNPFTCNQPLTVTDANSHTTTYTYTSTGQPQTVTSPSVGGVAPQTRLGYSSLYAWYKTGPSTIAQAPTPVLVLTSTSSCQTTASCSGTADEVLTSIGYTTGSSSTASNLLPTSVTTGAGSGGPTQTISTAYDAIGNVSTVQGPLGAGQTTAYFYDAEREVVGVVGPDPDGSGGPLLNRAVRTKYSADGLVTSVEQGTMTGQTDPTASGFTSLQQLATSYDGIDRKIQDTASAGGTTFAITQYSYDNSNLSQCTVVRMNPVSWSSLPDACSATTPGQYGEDRITQDHYDAAGELTSVDQGVMSSVPRTISTTYNQDGLASTVTDANGHVSTYAYDGLGRVVSLTYPDSTYQGYSYDAAGNVTTLRQRDGTTTIGFSYDALNRLSGKTPSDGGAVTYVYDNLGRLKSAATSSQTVSYSYDALGDQLTETEPLGTMTSGYDGAGRRTSLQWPDGFQVAYDYDTLGEMVDLKDGSTTLATFAYDDLGRRTGEGRANNISTAYGYDGISNLVSLAHTGSSKDQSYAYAYNPAGQIVSRSDGNLAYAYQTAAINQPYGVNALNQYTSVGGTGYGYDGRGNLGSGTAQAYTFDSQNRLLTASGSPSATLSYDPTDRLFQSAAGSTTQFLYDGDQIVGEYASGSLLRRYIDGPGEDEPVVWYEGSGSSDRRWLLDDERGSVIAVTNSAATVSSINTYDAFGQPGSSNTGRFQYTGQAWIPEVGAYDYKARFYLPSIGRFLQTDPSGYAEGMNLYAYAGGDPVDFSDPSGLDCGTITIPSQPPSVINYGTCNQPYDWGYGAGGGSPVLSNPLLSSTAPPPCALVNPGRCAAPEAPTEVSPVIIPMHPRPTAEDCDAIGYKGLGSMALDAVGLGFSIFAPEAKLVAGGLQIGVAGASMIYSGITGDVRGAGLAAVGYHYTAFTAPFDFKRIGPYIPIIGIAFSGYQLYRDYTNTEKAFRACRVQMR